MKKHLVLLIPTLLLTSCSKGTPITYEEATTKFRNEIALADADSLFEYGKMRLIINSKYDYEGNRLDQSGKHKYVFDYSKDKQYAHVKLTLGNNFSAEEWRFIKDGLVYSAAHRKINGSDEQKTYIVEGKAEGNLVDDYAVASIIDYKASDMRFPAYRFLELVGKKGTYLSSGKGNLEMFFKGSIEEGELSEKVNAKFMYENSLIKEARVSYSSNGFINPFTGLFEKTKTKINETVKVSKREVIKYPDLTKFERVY